MEMPCWGTSEVASMAKLFLNGEGGQDSTQFNADISRWDTSKVTSMESMFEGAAKFNQDISSWNTAKVTTMKNMFNGASVFDYTINTSGDKWNTA